jgi:hypothetical protein
MWMAVGNEGDLEISPGRFCIQKRHRNPDNACLKELEKGRYHAGTFPFIFFTEVNYGISFS